MEVDDSNQAKRKMDEPGTPAKKQKVDRPVKANIYVASAPAEQSKDEVTAFLKEQGIELLDIRPTETKDWLYFGQIRLARNEDQDKLAQLTGSLPDGRQIMTEVLPPVDDDKLDAPDECVLYIKNIGRSTSEDSLKALFPGVIDLRVPEKKGKKRGFGFLEFATKSEVDYFIANMQGVELDGKSLQLQTFSSQEQAVPQEDANISAMDTDAKASGSLAAFLESAQTEVSEHIRTVAENTPTSSRSKVLFIGNLNFETTEADVKGHFPMAKDVRILKCANTGESKGHGFIEFGSESDALDSLRMMKNAYIDGRKISLDVTVDKSPGTSNKPKSKVLFMGNLAYETMEQDVKKKFPECENCRILTNPSGKSKGVGFIDFRTVEDAEAALKREQGEMINGKALLLDYGRDRSSTPSTPDLGTRPKSKKLFVANLPFSTTEDTLRQHFPKCLDCRILKAAGTGRSKGMGFIDFKSIGEATAALNANRNAIIDGREIQLNYGEEKSIESSQNPPYHVLFIANLSDNTTESMIRNKFPLCEDVRILTNNGKSKGVGFIDFECVRDAEVSLKKMRNTVIDGKQIVLDFAKDRPGRNGGPKFGRDEFSQGPGVGWSDMEVQMMERERHRRALMEVEAEIAQVAQMAKMRGMGGGMGPGMGSGMGMGPNMGPGMGRRMGPGMGDGMGPGMGGGMGPGMGGMVPRMGGGMGPRMGPRMGGGNPRMPQGMGPRMGPGNMQGPGMGPGRGRGMMGNMRMGGPGMGNMPGGNMGDLPGNMEELTKLAKVAQTIGVENLLRLGNMSGDGPMGQGPAFGDYQGGYKNKNN